MKTPRIFLALMTCALAAAPALAQFVGPNGSPTTVRQLEQHGRDYEPVVLTGHIVARVGHKDLYQFSDGTGTLVVKIDGKHWPAGLRVDEKTRVTLAGKYDREGFGFSKVKVFSLQPAP
ncbi:MAG: NirD/YgiW/YdeI family stress tolerance protein [Candidatus Dactylopiibacterium sp.]|nr:NirD/YgiW/YdeI family stress tolerance protein [Candidatus Dactylopiibacterium sp.]